MGTLRYTPYGVVRYEWGHTPTDRLFTGQRWDSGLALYDYRARTYDPLLGRFISVDPLVPRPGNPQALNRYAYVLNNPLRYTDPSGHCPWCLVIGKAILQTAVDVGIDYLIARATGGEFHLARSLAVNAALNVTTLGVGSTVAKLCHLGKLATLASHADEAAEAARAVAQAVRHADEAADALRAAERVEEAVEQAIGQVLKEEAENVARGGTYMLVDRVTGEVQYVGRTNNLARRAAEHARDPIKGQLRFKVDWQVDDYAIRRGREQILYEQYRPPLNRIRPISPRNPRLQEYLKAARRFEELLR